MEEIWKDIEGFEGWYQVSNLGNIRSLNRYVNHWRGGKMLRVGKLLRPSIDKLGYCKIDLKQNQQHNYLTCHRLVAKTFIPNPLNLPWVCHKDNNPSNNRVDNLYWGTPTDNNRQTVVDGRRKNTKGIPRPELQGENSGNAVFTNEEVRHVRKLLADNKLSLTEIGKLYGTTKGTIWKIKAGYSWQYVV